jgi:TonB family protein
MQSGARPKREEDGRGAESAALPSADSLANRVPDSQLISPASPRSDSVVSPAEDSVVEFSPHGRLPRLDLGIDWESPWREFCSSLNGFFCGPRAPETKEPGSTSRLRVDWVGGKNSPWAFAVSSVWHVIAVTLLVLPIWGFLPPPAHNLAPVRLEVNWSVAQDLPAIHLAPKLAPPAFQKTPPTPKRAGQDIPAPTGADAFHPRQTILSTPVQLTHPRQTLIEPAAPMTAPNIVAKLPNVVEWAASAPKVQLVQSAAPPKLRERELTAVAPDVADPQSNAVPLDLAPSTIPALRPPIPQMVATAPRSRRSGTASGGTAPQLAGTNGDAGLRNVIALSSSPAPPRPVTIPEGNLAARVALSPAGTRAGAPSGGGRGISGGKAGHDGSGSLPVAVNISAGGLAANHPGATLDLKPRASLSERPRRTGPADLAALKPNEPPEALLYGKEVHTLDINLPNVTSVSGSWILNFAQLDEGGSPFNRPKGDLSGPVPVIKVDPKYPPQLINEHVEGEVVLYAIVRANGSVDAIQVVRKLDPRLDRYAVEAFARWKFRPATRDGVPVDVEAVVHIPFRYRLPQR